MHWKTPSIPGRRRQPNSPSCVSPSPSNPPPAFASAHTNQLPYGASAANPAKFTMTRPEGSFAARVFGNAVHTFLELLAARIAAGHTPAALLAELPAWTPRINAILRAAGLPPATVDRLTRETRAALANTLRDRDGIWLLAPHPGAATELALTAWANLSESASSSDTTAASIRVDRTFHAGPEPHTTGSDYLWIVDYKTASHGPSGMNDFLTSQRATYAPQLEAYAAILAPAQSIPPERIRLALYYPAIPRLIWWQPSS